MYACMNVGDMTWDICPILHGHLSDVEMDTCPGHVSKKREGDEEKASGWEKKRNPPT